MSSSRSATLYAAVAAILLAGCDAAPVAKADARKTTDTEALCAPYGGYGRFISQHGTITPYRHSTSVTIECADGSWLSRTVDVRP